MKGKTVKVPQQGENLWIKLLSRVTTSLSSIYIKFVHLPQVSPIILTPAPRWSPVLLLCLALPSPVLLPPVFVASRRSPEPRTLSPQPSSSSTLPRRPPHLASTVAADFLSSRRTLSPRFIIFHSSSPAAAPRHYSFSPARLHPKIQSELEHVSIDSHTL
ncbi:hypothetical protein ACOSQ4_029955 [Xanthoceras sorbifolium]